ncbi:DUF1853 family protein [Halopseudomonas salina]|uniref:DUF1853 family protein n=1 Tax=Halopseudomonas salina TaxID=1323744 RepID=A0ABQ1PZA4_9GAMM|nr:DUF1853 family protein [Halopseudomonas salina]GGD07785.1 hypothetical protein GCM10007418_28560 [Halopseudomonas salina]
MKSDSYSPIDPTGFRIPAIRHLAWMCGAAQLTDSPLAFDLRAQLPAGTMQKLLSWEAMPDTAPAMLTQPAQPRLGYYFERLYACLLTDVLGWEVMARNLPIRNQERTLGELDFVVRNPATGAIEHHEIAIKFYLGYIPDLELNMDQVRWYGPNAVDRLDLKTARMLDHQSQRSLLPESVMALAELGIEPPVRSRVFMPGYLFYPLATDCAKAVSPPCHVPSDHQRGTWMYLDAVSSKDISRWVQLRKPHWLGPWLQSDEPDPAEAQAALEQIALTQTPRLFARMYWDETARLWQEAERCFVVPARWPD